MPKLVPIPWQRHLYLTPSTLSRVVRASEFYGSPLYLYDAEYKRISPAWRSFAQQLTAWLRATAKKGPPASSPYTGQRNHMRGAAFDLRLTTARAQAACRLAGLKRDSVEPWHWNDPNAARMPIIKTRDAGIPKPVPRKKKTMTLVLDPYSGGKNPTIYWVVGNGKPYLFRGTTPAKHQAEANAFVKFWGYPTLTPSKAQWDNGFLKQYGA